jgi:hypothetical protein
MSALDRWAPRGSWIQSPGYDLGFFILAPALTLPIVMLELWGWGRVALAGGVLALAHYLSTFAFFAWDENRLHWRTHWVPFFAGPVVICLGYLALVASEAFRAISFLLFFWNAYHVSRQSCGLLSIYRHRGGVADPRQKEVANGAIVSTSLWLALWNIETHGSVLPLLAAVSPRLPGLLRLGLGVVAVVSLGRLALALGRRAGGGGLRLPELAFVGTSLLLFNPYLWLPTSGGATYAMLLPHYVQYLGLLWLVHRRKFRSPEGSPAQRALQRLSAHTVTLVGVLATVSVTIVAVRFVLVRAGHPETFEAFYLLLAFVHFYLDALLWAFRDPHVRRMLAPHLMQGAVARG